MDFDYIILKIKLYLKLILKKVKAAAETKNI